MTDDANLPAIDPAKAKRYGWNENGMTPRMQRFVEEYMVDLNGTQAAIRAGYSPRSARSAAMELLDLPKVVEALSHASADRSEKTRIDKAFVIAKLVKAHDDADKIEGVKGITARLRALELIGRHVDVRAWVAQGLPLSFGGGENSPWDLSRLDVAELETFERLLAKISVAGTSESGEGSPAHGSGEGEPSAES